MGIIGRRFVSDFSFEVSILIPWMDQPRPQSALRCPEPIFPEIQPPAYRARMAPALKQLTALTLHVRFAGPKCDLKKIIPNKPEGR
jgi:hypothetical protein